MSDTELNQTDFATHQPLMEESTVVAPVPSKPVEPKPERPIHKPTPILLVVIVLIVLAFILTLVLTFQKNERAPGAPGTATPTPSAAAQSNRPPELQQAIDQYEQDVKQADPATNNLPIPPVNFSLHFASPAP